MTRNFWLAPALLAGVAMAGTAQADSTFIKPSSTIFAGSANTVTFDAAGSDHLFSLDHRPVPLTAITITRPDGTAAQPANGVQQRLRSAFDVRLDQEGTWRVASEQVMVGGTFMLDGQQRRVGGRGGPPPGVAMAGQRGAGEGTQVSGGERPRGEGGELRLPPVALADIPANATQVHLTETVNRAETFVTVGAPSDLKPSAKGLAFDPLTQPNALAQGETARFRYLIDGKPAAGIRVTVVADGVRYRENSDPLVLTTDRDGTVSITWPRAGLYWLGAEAEDRNPSETKAETRKMSTSVTLEVMTP